MYPKIEPKTFEPSSGGIGIMLKNASTKFKVTVCNRICDPISFTLGYILKTNPATKARAILVSGPTIAIKNMSRRMLDKLL